MKMIGDYEVFEPGECYFAVGYDDPSEKEYASVYISPISTWNKRECLDDSFGSHSLDDEALPLDLSNSMEATWESKYSPEEIRTAMLERGFLEGPEEMQEFLFSDE